MSADKRLQLRVLRCRYNKFIPIFKPLPRLLQLLLALYESEF